MSRVASARAEAARTDRSSASRQLPRGYLKQSQLPLAGLLFLLPFIVLYEWGTWHFAFDASAHVEQRIRAFIWMHQFFDLFGATGRYMPPVAVAGILLSIHIARNDPWQVKPNTLLGMLLESCAWAMPLVAIGSLAASYLYHHLPLMTGQGDWRTMFVLSIGAGIYEELVFRLIGLTVLHILVIDLLRVPKKWGYLVIVLTTSILFAQYHYWGGEPFQWRSFAFRTVAGAYFAGLFLFRGFGVTAFSHSAYDMILVCLRVSAGA
jgi:hypothetical protein